VPPYPLPLTLAEAAENILSILSDFAQDCAECPEDTAGVVDKLRAANATTRQEGSAPAFVCDLVHAWLNFMEAAVDHAAQQARALEAGDA
jgi:hypothetical protein